MSAFPRRWKAILALAVIILLAGFFWYYRTQRKHVLEDANSNLEAIAQLQINWIGEWRSSRLKEATTTMNSRFYTPLVAGWMQSPPAAQEVDAIKGGLKALRDQYLYEDALFVSASGHIYFRLNDSSAPLHEISRKGIEKAFQTRKPVLTDLYLSSEASYPQIDVIAPFFMDLKGSSIPSGAIIFQYDAGKSIYPIIRWPVPNRSAEALLVRREGDSVLFLNELSHRKDSALKYRLPMSAKDAPAVRGVLGERGAIQQGRDYRGVQVLAVAEPAPDTGWFLIAKIDEDEVFASFRREYLLISIMLLFLMASVSSAIAVLWQRNDKAHYREMLETEAVRRKNEELYRNALDSISEGCQIIDFEWRHLFINATALKHSNHRKEDLLSRTLMDVFPGIESTDVFAAYKRCMEERAPQHAEISLDYPDGTMKWYELSAQPIPEGIFVLTSDITERKNAEEDLRKSEEKYRSLFDHMIQGAFRIESNGNISDVNLALLKMAGFTKEQFLKKTLANVDEWEFIHEDGVHFTIDERPGIIALKTGKPSSAVVGMCNPITNNIVWTEISAVPEFLEGDSNPYQVLVTLHDITDRKKAEAENERLASAIAQCDEIIAILDTNKIVQYVNPAFEKIPGLKLEEAVGHSLPVNEWQDEAFYREFWSTLESGKTWRGRLTNRKKDGTIYTEDATVSPVLNASGAIVNYISVTRDITEFLKLQSEKEKLQDQFLQAQKMESVGRLAGGIAHDFNNMLSVIGGHAQLALDAIDPGHPLYPHLQEINKAALHSADLTRQLLTFARKQTISPKVLNLNSIIVESLSILQRLIGEDIDLAWMPGHELWPVNIDPAQVNQILTNLVVNARDAIDKNGRIVIETQNMILDENYCTDHQEYIPGEYVMLALSDNGRGMGKDVIGHLFEPFFTTKKMGEGTGLGLATVYGIVQQNSGYINIYSEPNRGTTFKIYLPRHISTETPKETAIEAETSKGGAETILLVEDEPAVLSLTRRMLERLGYTVIAAASPNEAIGLAQKYSREIQLLLVDVIMPEMSGRELSEQIIRLRPGLKILFMSGYTADVIAHRGVLDQGLHFIQKPFSSKELASKVREAIEINYE
jgi:two-component system, cell cycle sensor histidine kinase and response regulator CckA